MLRFGALLGNIGLVLFVLLYSSGNLSESLPEHNSDKFFKKKSSNIESEDFYDDFFQNRRKNNTNKKDSIFPNRARNRNIFVSHGAN